MKLLTVLTGYVSISNFMPLIMGELIAEKITSYDAIPTPYLESTPYTTMTKTNYEGGSSYLAVMHVYRSIIYEENCSSTYSSETPDATTLIIW